MAMPLNEKATEGDAAASVGSEGHEDRVKDMVTPVDQPQGTEPKQASATIEAAAPAPALPMSKWRLVALVLTLTGAALLNTLSIQACVIMLPTIGDDLDIPTARQQWIISAYSLAFGCFLLPWGRVADVYGKRNIFLYGSVWVTVITLVMPFIPNEVGFDLFRGLQGFGAAANVPTAIGILGVTFPPGKAKNYAFSTYAAGAPLGSVLGNILSGTMTQYVSWKWVFWVLAIIALLVTVCGYCIIPVPPPPTAHATLATAVDWPGAVTITVALFALLFALTDGNIVGWDEPYIGVIIAISVLLIAAFAYWQHYLETRTTRRPLMKVSLFRNSRVAAAMVICTFFNGSFNNFLIFATELFQDYQGHDPLETMLRFIPTGVVGLLTVFFTAHILARVPLNYICIFSMICCTISSLLFAIPIPANTTYWAYGLPGTSLAVLAADTIFPSLILFIAHSLPKEDQAVGGAMINAFGQVGRSVGLAIGTAIQVAVQDARAGNDDAATESVTEEKGSQAFLDGLRAAEWFNVGLALAGLITVVFAFRGVGIIGGKK